MAKAKSKKKNKITLKTLLMTIIIGVLFVAAVVGLFLPFLTRTYGAGTLKVTHTIGLFKFEEGVGVTTIVMSILTLIGLVGVAVITVLKLFNVEVPAVIEKVVCIATAILGVVVMILVMVHCADISEPLVTLKQDSYTLTFTSFMFTLGSAAASLVALFNKD